MPAPRRAGRLCHLGSVDGVSRKDDTVAGLSHGLAEKVVLGEVATHRLEPAASAGLRKPVGEVYPEPRLLDRIVAAGIPVTFSSDAHAPAEVGWGYERTVAEALACGVSEFVTIEKRRKFAHPLRAAGSANATD